VGPSELPASARCLASRFPPRITHSLPSKRPSTIRAVVGRFGDLENSNRSLRPNKNLMPSAAPALFLGQSVSQEQRLKTMAVSARY
jgi:hypothetical protein